MRLHNLIPGLTTAHHVIHNIGKGIQDEGLLGAAKVVAKGLSKDWMLGIVTGGTTLAVQLGAVGADVFGLLDLPSEETSGEADNAPKTAEPGGQSTGKPKGAEVLQKLKAEQPRLFAALAKDQPELLQRMAAG